MATITKTGATEMVVVGPILDVSGNVLTGLTNLYLTIARTSDRAFWDFTHSVFSTSPTGSTTSPLSEWDSTRMPGVYYYSLNTSSFTGVSSQDHYEVYISQSGGTLNAANLPMLGEIRMGQIVDAVEGIGPAPLATAAGLTNLQTHGDATWGSAPMLGASLVSYTDRTTVGGALHFLRKFASNRIEEAPGNPGTLKLYDDNGTTLLLTYNLTDYQGNAFVGAVGQLARRAAGA